MRTGAEYRESLRDGRNIWVIGEGPVDDVTSHPATAAMVEEYVAWYDRHFDPDWHDVLLTEPDANSARRPLAFEAPRRLPTSDAWEKRYVPFFSSPAAMCPTRWATVR
jgi:aromatic ring hydroxylase